MSLDRAARNRASEARLLRVAGGLPPPVLAHARAHRIVPPLPRLAVESYWRVHPLRADRLARALAGCGTQPDGWRWGATARDCVPFRTPPTPFREDAFRLDAGRCCVCGQPVYRLGWHQDLWGDGVHNRRASWHACCVAAWRLWTAPADQAGLLRKVQRRRCGVSGDRLARDAEVDHRVPLYQVWRDHRDEPWPALLRFWGLPNLQLVNRPRHASKCAAEARDRAGRRASRPSIVAPVAGAECTSPM